MAHRTAPPGGHAHAAAPDADGDPAALPASPVVRVLLLGLGWVCVGLGGLGAFLPVLPTTPFLLVAAWAFARSSRRLRGWLYGHPRFGAALRAWHEHGAIPRRAKVLSLVGMSLSFAWVLLQAEKAWLPVVVGLTLLAVAAFVLTRPEPPRTATTPAE